MLETIVRYRSSDPTDLTMYEWHGDAPLLHSDLLIQLPHRAAARTTTVTVVFLDTGKVQQHVLTR